MSHVHLQFCLHKHSVDMNINVVAFPLSLVIGFPSAGVPCRPGVDTD